MTWHVDNATAERYTSGTTDGAVAASLEAHLMACEQCRALVNEAADDVTLADAWQGIVDILDTPRTGWVETAMLRAGCSEPTGRIVAATTRARFAYLFVVAFDVMLAVVSARARNADALFAAFLLLAPLGPLVATASAFGRWFDPCHALMRPLPTSTWKMILIRTVAAVVPAIVLTGLSLPWVADRGWLAVAWLLPALALSLVALALSSWFDVEVVCITLAVVWVAVPLALQLPVDQLLDLLAGPVQVISVAVGAAGLATAIARQARFEYRGL
jgi:hypothetical protein